MRKSKFAKKGLVMVISALLMTLGAVVPLHHTVFSERRIQLNNTSEYPTLHPGDVYRSTLNIQNSGDQMLKYKISVTPYSVNDYNYDTQFDQQNDYTLLANWIALGHSTGALEAGESVAIPYTIKVPNDVPAGGQYAAVIAEMVDENTGQSIVAHSSVAKIIYATIDGDTTRTGSIDNNVINGVYFNAPVTATSVVNNTGNIHEDVISTLEVFGLFDNKSVYSNVDKPDKHTVLPKTHRENKVSWDDAPMVGLFKVKQTVTFMGQSSVNEKVVLICPLWLLILIGVFIVGVVLWIILRIRERRAADKKSTKKSTKK